MAYPVVHGVTIPLNSDEVSPTIWAALTKGDYEANEVQLVTQAVQPNDRVLELGTGLGVVTSTIAGVEGSLIWSFDANPATSQLAARVVEANGHKNVQLTTGLLTAGNPKRFKFYIRSDLWMSSVYENQGPYETTIDLISGDIDQFITKHSINVVVMDIEGAEHDLLVHANLPGIERIFVELHDHLYGLIGVREIMAALAAKGFAYDPRASNGACLVFTRSEVAREYQLGQANAR
ncbi:MULTISPECIES: FkbM family methyltransferase [Phyllobacterium]|uniref:FkbM family methyltransferase n=1 Tax=Phyllobacterium TaxID=28100 RepID=UPI001CC0A4BA|nr:FkbM family methyltransferase [Phyllobacterium calauticae]MBZ3695468.1 FkbM family methyltransferase [Phyllobacterium calauticae]